MNILQASGLLLTWFTEKEFFNFKSDLKVLTKGVKITDEQAEAVTLCALNSLESAGYIKKVAVAGGNEHWVLVKSLQLFDQQLVISAFTANRVSKTINAFYQMVGEKDFVSNPTQISELDLTHLLFVCNMLAQSAISQTQEKAPEASGLKTFLKATTPEESDQI